ncbi:MAG: PIN domain-containing protein [Dehalococcoidia bacterium]|nr:PIN domain-containing protein [Dehalococcoidia bacterium]
MADHLLDSGVLIRHLRGRHGYRALVEQLAGEGQLWIASISRLEVVAGMRNHERPATFALLDSLLTCSLDAETADGAGELIRAWRSRGVVLDPGDSVIAASAIRHGLALVTTNAKHFPMPQLAVLAVDDQGDLHPSSATP